MSDAKNSSDSESNASLSTTAAGALAHAPGLTDATHSDDEAGKERLHAACIAVARRLRRARDEGASRPAPNWRIGLFPAAKEITILPVALVLAGALEELTGEHVAVVGGISQAQPPSHGRPGGRPFFVEGSLGRRVSLFASEGAVQPGNATSVLTDLFERTADRGFGFWLLDLTGIARAGEHLDVADSLDELVLVAAAGKTREHDLLTLNEELGLAQGARIGVLLTGETR